MPTDRIQVRTPEGRYTIHVGAGIRDRIGELIGAAAPATRYAVISDSNVAPLHGDAVRDALATLAPTELLTFPAGEASKTRQSWARLTDALLDAGLGRDGCIVAVGGGVTGDLAGFVAATYLRGVPLIQCPTSLLAMVDASVGGKTGVDTKRGKNLVGAFHQPACVIADVSALATLPEPELRAGLAEVVKHACIADAAQLERLTAADPLRSSASLPSVVAHSVRIKARFVEADVREAGPRMALNFGHTVGHAIERVLDYRISHGRAVAAGMAAEAAIGEAAGVTERGTADRVRSALTQLSLPATLPDLEADRLLAAMRVDKKRRSGRTRYTLLRRVGEVARTGDGAWTFDLDHGVVRDAIDRWIGEGAEAPPPEDARGAQPP